MRRRGGAVYVVALAQTRSREDARSFELARFPTAREADDQADGGGSNPAQAHRVEGQPPGDEVYDGLQTGDTACPDEVGNGGDHGEADGPAVYARLVLDELVEETQQDEHDCQGIQEVEHGGRQRDDLRKADVGDGERDDGEGNGVHLVGNLERQDLDKSLGARGHQADCGLEAA